MKYLVKGKLFVPIGEGYREYQATMSEGVFDTREDAEKAVSKSATMLRQVSNLYIEVTDNVGRKLMLVLPHHVCQSTVIELRIDEVQ